MLFSKAQIDKINAVAAKSKEALSPPKVVNTKGLTTELAEMSAKVQEYFKDSEAILISDETSLHEYVDKIIECGYAGIDTETTGLDRVKDTIVGASLYYPGSIECYIPMKHVVPIFDEPYKNQLTYEVVGREFQRLVDNKVKLIFANADFDLAMIYKDLKADLIPSCYYDVILAWRCLKENERDNSLKSLYAKYVLKGKGDPMKFRDFFTPQLFPYCSPMVARLYAANDAKITYKLFEWQLRYVTKSDPKCQRSHLESIADLVWNVEFPLIKVCQNLHRRGVYLDKEVADKIKVRYQRKYDKEVAKLADLVQGHIQNCDYRVMSKSPFHSGKEFNPRSTTDVRYLLKDIMHLDLKGGTDKEALAAMNLPVTNQILAVRSLATLISTFVDKLPKATTPDSKIHAQFKQIGADTGRFSSAEPNLQNIPSHASDIRHMFRATAARKEERACIQDNDISILELSAYDRVYKEGHVETVVHDLVVGDRIEAFDDKILITMTIKSIDVDDLSPTTRIHLVRVE